MLVAKTPTQHRKTEYTKHVNRHITYPNISDSNKSMCRQPVHSTPTLPSDNKSLPRLQLSRPPDTSGAPTAEEEGEFDEDEEGEEMA
jgi:hypothetical protein